jgi:hypothetical protein
MSDVAPTRTIVVIIGSVDGDTRDEAMRAALGLTLRHAAVRVVVAPLGVTLSAEAARASATLILSGHRVDNPGVVSAALRTADAVEIWGPVDPAPGLPPPGRLTHLVRPGRRQACLMGGEPVLHLPPVLDRDDADRLLDQLLAGGPVAVW